MGGRPCTRQALLCSFALGVWASLQFTGWCNHQTSHVWGASGRWLLILVGLSPRAASSEITQEHLWPNERHELTPRRRGKVLCNRRAYVTALIVTIFSKRLEPHEGIKAWDSSDPRQGPESPFPGKEGFGVQKLPSPLLLEKGVSVKKFPFFSAREHIENGDFWAKNSLFQPL